jgi:hypothetical protein
MASLQAYTSHGIQYYRIVESFRNNGKPSIRVLAHLGRVDDILQRHRQQPKDVPVRIASVSAGAPECRESSGITCRWQCLGICGTVCARAPLMLGIWLRF